MNPAHYPALIAVLGAAVAGGLILLLTHGRRRWWRRRRPTFTMPAAGDEVEILSYVGALGGYVVRGGLVCWAVPDDGAVTLTPGARCTVAAIEMVGGSPVIRLRTGAQA